MHLLPAGVVCAAGQAGSWTQKARAANKGTSWMPSTFAAEAALLTRAPTAIAVLYSALCMRALLELYVEPAAFL